MTLELSVKLKQKRHMLPVLAGMLWAGAVQADTMADTEADCRIENNELTCKPLNDVKPAGTTSYPGGRTVRISIPLQSGNWAAGRAQNSIDTYPELTQQSILVSDKQGQDVSARCPLTVSLTHWTHSTANAWTGADKKSNGYPHLADRVWWAGVLKSTGDIASCPLGELQVKLVFTPRVINIDTGNSWGSLPPVQADFRVLNTKHVSLRVPPTIGLALTDHGAAGSGIILLRRWGDVSMEVTRADDGGEPSLNPPSGSSTVPLPLDVTLDTLSGRRNVAKGSKDNVIGWDRRAGENGYRLNITTKGNVKKQLTDEPGTWRSTLRVTVNAL